MLKKSMMRSRRYDENEGDEADGYDEEWDDDEEQ
jgi:hypothetical protein